MAALTVVDSPHEADDVTNTTLVVDMVLDVASDRGRPPAADNHTRMSWPVQNTEAPLNMHAKETNGSTEFSTLHDMYDDQLSHLCNRGISVLPSDTRV